MMTNAYKPLYQLLVLNSKNLIILEDKYQRSAKENRVAKIAANFNETIANEPKISFRDGKYYVFDGQHTIAARKVLHGGDLDILCKVYNGLTEEDEAILFAMQTGISSKPTSGERMRAWLYGNDKEAVAFREVTESTGLVLELGGARCENHLVCISTALRAYRKLGATKYKEALEIIVDAWGGHPDSLLGEIISGMCEFVYIYQGMYSRSRLIARLRNIDPIEIWKDGKKDFNLTGKKKYVNQIYLIYNGASKKNALPYLH